LYILLGQQFLLDKEYVISNFFVSVGSAFYLSCLNCAISKPVLI
jgi:hypothetical protein